jgi:hypothetical protein
MSSIHSFNLNVNLRWFNKNTEILQNEIRLFSSQLCRGEIGLYSTCKKYFHMCKRTSSNDIEIVIHEFDIRLIFTKEKDIIRTNWRPFLSHKNTSSLIRRVSLWRGRACQFTEINVSKWNFQELYCCLNVTRLKDCEIFLCKCIVQVFGASVLCSCFAEVFGAFARTNITIIVMNINRQRASWPMIIGKIYRKVCTKIWSIVTGNKFQTNICGKVLQCIDYYIFY